MDIIKHQRISFTVATTLIMSVFLLVLLGTFFAMTFISSDVMLDRAIHRAVDNPESYNDFAQTSLKAIYVKTDCYGEPKVLEGGGDNLDKIVNKAIDVKDGKFHVDGRYFIVASKSAVEDATLYAVIERTSYHNQTVNFALQLSLIYLCAVAIIALLAFVCSARLLRPVADAFSKQRDLVANASHELKTPLTVISTDMSVIKSEPSSTIEENQKWIESIDAQISRMKSLIQNMLELSKLEHASVQKEVLNFSLLVEGACLTFEPVCYEKNVELVSEVQSGVFILGEKNSIDRLAIILLDNAIKYCGEAGKVGVRLFKDGNKAILRVMNTGESLSKEETEHVFDRFYRTDGARKNADNQSFGLGLSIAAATVRAHGGTIVAKGVEGKGTVFAVTLPIDKTLRPKKTKKK